MVVAPAVAAGATPPPPLEAAACKFDVEAFGGLEATGCFEEASLAVLAAGGLAVVEPTLLTRLAVGLDVVAD